MIVFGRQPLIAYAKYKAIAESYFALGAATWHTGRNMTSRLIFDRRRHYFKTRRYPQNRKYI